MTLTTYATPPTGYSIIGGGARVFNSDGTLATGAHLTGSYPSTDGTKWIAEAIVSVAGAYRLDVYCFSTHV